MITSPRHQGETSEWADANWRAVLEAAPDAMLVVNRTGEIVAANQQATKLYGYSREHLIGRAVESLIPARLRDRHRLHRENFFAHPEIQTTQVIEIFAVRSDASEIPVDVSLRLLTIGTETFAISAVRDATERPRIEELKRAAAVLRESEERFRLIADTAPVLIWMSGTDKLCTYFNKPWLEFTGRSLESELGNGWAEGVHPEDLQRCLDAYTQSFDRQEKFRMEYRLRQHDGEYRWILDVGVPRFNADGSFEGYIGIGVDVNDRKRAEETAIRHTAILESSDDAIIATDVSGTVTDWNKGAERLFNYPASEAIGKNISFLSAPDSTQEAQGILKKVINGEAVKRHETVRRRKDGAPVDISLTASPILDAASRVVGVSGIARDITERKRAEEAVKESETRFRLVADTAPVMIWMSGLDKKPTYFNQLWLDFTGLSETDLRNGLAGITHPEDYPKCHDIYCRAFDQRQPFRKECRLRRHDGQYRWMLDIGVPRFHEDGSFAGYIGSCIDVTDHKLAEEALSDMTRKLVAAQEKERTRIARELHDDINQRLAMLAVELEQVQNDPSEIQQRVSELRKQTTEISSDVQALSHDLHSSHLEYLGAVAAMKNWCKEFGERQGMQIDCRQDVRSTLPQEIGLCLFRVLQEALHNAAKHSGVKRIEVQLHDESDEIHVTIRDFGKGFDVEAAVQGRGLGLTSMKERIRLVNGTIEIQSKPMGGTTVHVRVPLRSESAPQRAAG